MLDALDTIFWFLVGRKIQPNKIAYSHGKLTENLDRVGYLKLPAR